MAAEPAHIAVILAAGGSRRLGRPKQLLRRKGETLLHRTVRLARETGPRRVLVVLGAGRDALAPSLRNLDADVIANPEWEQGLSSSLRCVAQTLSSASESVLLLACDQPALEVSHLHALLALARGATSGCAATRHGPHRGIPVLVTPQVLRQAFDVQGDRGLRDVLGAIDRDAIGMLDATELTIDIDTMDDVAAAEARGWLDASN